MVSSFGTLPPMIGPGPLTPDERDWLAGRAPPPVWLPESTPPSSLAPSNTMLGILQRLPERGGILGQLFGSLPTATQRTLEPWGPMLNPLEWTPGAAVRDAVDASGETARAAGRLDPWGMLNGVGSMGAAMLAMAFPPAKLGKAPRASTGSAPHPSTPSERLTVDQALRLRPVVASTDARGALGILREGQFKSQFETGTSRGTLNNARRAKVEKRMFGLPEDLDPLQRPIYGMMGLAPRMPHATGIYGDYTFLFRPEVKGRTTYTFGDSLDHNGGLRVRQWNAPGDPRRRATNIRPYIEAQISRITQGLPLTDVERVLVADSEAARLAAVRRQLDRRRIPYDVMPPTITRLDSPEAVNWYRQFGLMVPPLMLGGLWSAAPEEKR
jgi:hypothetical protein